MYYIGMDGGGSNTIGIIGKADQILFETTAGPSNYHNIGKQGTQATIKELLFLLLDHIGVSLSEVDTICFGGAGVDTPADEAVIKSIFSEIGFKGGLIVVNDALVAMASETGHLTGGILISGTGSIAVGMDDEGEVHRVGGWGHLADDYGSGYRIGIRAIEAIFKAYDGRGNSTELFEVLKDQMAVSSVPDIIDFLYNRGNQKHQIAALAKTVTILAETDQVAKSIIEQTALDLVEMCFALQKKVKQSPLEIVLSGSVVMNNDAIVNKMKALLPGDIHVKRLSERPVVGAYKLAKNKK